MAEKTWAEMNWRERREKRYKWWLDAEGVNFVSAEAKKLYRQRVQRMINVYNVEEPDRVPVSLPAGSTPAYAYDTDYHSCSYDIEKAVKAWDKFNEEFKDADTAASPAMILSGKIYDILDFKLYKWPGHGLPENAPGIQFVEGEYMKPNE